MAGAKKSKPKAKAKRNRKPRRGPKCGAKTKSDGHPCRNTAGFKTGDHVGAGRCHLHGGCTPSGRKSAQKIIATKAVATYGLPREIEPQDALLEEIWRTAGAVDWLQAVVSQMDPDDLVYGLHEEFTGGEHGGQRKYRAAPNVWLTKYQEERRHLVLVCRTAIAAGIAERQVRLAEETGKMIADVIKAVLKDLGVANHPKANETVRKHLSLVAGGAQ